MTGRAARGIDVLHLELEQDGLALHVAEAEVHVAGEAAPAVAVEERAGNAGLDALDQAIAQGASRAQVAERCRSTSSRAAPQATMPATFSVPARRWPSWSPPWISGARGVPRRT